MTILTRSKSRLTRQSYRQFRQPEILKKHKEPAIRKIIESSPKLAMIDPDAQINMRMVRKYKPCLTLSSPKFSKQEKPLEIEELSSACRNDKSHICSRKKPNSKIMTNHSELVNRTTMTIGTRSKLCLTSSSPNILKEEKPLDNVEVSSTNRNDESHTNSENIKWSNNESSNSIPKHTNLGEDAPSSKLKKDENDSSNSKESPLSYTDMVKAKRRRNEEVMRRLGLIDHKFRPKSVTSPSPRRARKNVKSPLKEMRRCRKSSRNAVSKIKHGFYSETRLFEEAMKQSTSEFEPIFSFQNRSGTKIKNDNEDTDEDEEELADVQDNNQIDFSKFSEDMWSYYIEQLEQYRKNHGHCNVPVHFQRNPGLGLWVYNQRCQYKTIRRKKLSLSSSEQEKFEMLERMGLFYNDGFNWHSFKMCLDFNDDIISDYRYYEWKYVISRYNKENENSLKQTKLRLIEDQIKKLRW